VIISVNDAALVCVFGFRFFFAGSSLIVISGEESFSAATLLYEMISLEGSKYSTQEQIDRDTTGRNIKFDFALNQLRLFTSHDAAFTSCEFRSTFSSSVVQVDNIFEVLVSSIRSLAPHAARTKALSPR